MKKSSKNNSLKLLIIGGIAICAVGGIFFVGNEYVEASHYDSPEIIPTSYQEPAPPKEVSKDYKKPNIQIVENEVMRSTNENAISASEAAEIGAEYLWDMFEADLDGKVMYMSFTTDPSRAIGYWGGDVYDNKDDIKKPVSSEYGFSIEGVTGERNSASYNKSTDTGKTIPYEDKKTDSYYKEHCDEYLKLAKTYAGKQLQGTPKEAVFHGVGASIAPGYTYEIPEGSTMSMTAPDYEEPADLIKVPQGEEIQASFIWVDIWVTDESGTQVSVWIDVTSKELLLINQIYTGIDYDPGSIG